MTELEKLRLSQPLTDVYTAMERDLMLAIAKQIAKDGDISATSQWRLQRLAEAGDLNETAIKIIASYTGIQSDLLTEAISDAAYSVIDKLEPAFQELAKQGLISDTPIPASRSVNQAIQTFRKQAVSDLNLVNTVMRYKAKQAYVDLVNKTYDAVNAVADVTNRQELLNTLGKHTMSTVMGIESRQEAVRKCIKEFSDKGIPAFVDAAGREWSPEAYINMDIRTTVSNTANAAQDARCDDYGIDLIEVSSHPGARPKCAPYQGRIFSRSNQSGIAHDGNGKEIPYKPLSSTSYGEPDGLFGINCKHKKYPFIDGVNFQRYFPYDKEENDKRYKEIQEQRRLERKIRKTKTEADMLKEIGDTEGAKAARAKLKTQRKAYKTYCDDHDLTQRSDRLAVMGNRTNATKEKNDIKYAASNFEPNRVEFNSNATFTTEVPKYSKEINSSVSDACRQVVTDGIKTNNEHLVLVNAKTGLWNYQEEGTSGNVGGQDFWDYVKAHNTDKFIFVHNHADGNTFSIEDLCTFMTTDCIDGIVAACDNGKVYYVYGIKKPLQYQNPIMEVIMNSDAIENMQVSQNLTLKDLKKQYENGIISFAEYNKTRLIKQSEFIIQNYCEFEEFDT